MQSRVLKCCEMHVSHACRHKHQSIQVILPLQVAAQLKGELPLPWEEEISPVVVRQLGVFRGPVMQLLQREPSDRISMDHFHALCSKVFSGQSTDAAARV